MRLRYYISGHGLGHASRSCQIIETLRERHPDVEVSLASTAQAWFLRLALGPTLEILPYPWACGVAQHDSLRIDIPATLAAYRPLREGHAAWLAEESEVLRRDRVDLVVSDIPAPPLAAAARAGIPGVGVSNFTWDWIFRGLAGSYPAESAALLELADLFAGDYRHAGRILTLPFAPAETGGPLREDVPLVARRARRGRSEIRARLAIPEGKKLGLVSFGGFGTGELDLRPLAGLNDWVFLTESAIPGHVPNLRPLINGEHYYPDLVAAADALITKPGYGIVSEAIANRTAVLYTSRGAFPEQELLVAGLRRHARSLEISNADFRRGRWGEALERLLAQPLPDRLPPCDGAAVVADRLVELARKPA